MNSAWRSIGTWAIVVVLSGCGDPGSSRRAMYGTVKYLGENVKAGAISFLPQESGPAANAKITNGQYKFSGSNGPKVGKYEVVITVAPDDDKSIKSGNAKHTTIEWTTEIELTPKSPRQKDFQFP